MFNLDLVDAAFRDAFPAATETNSVEYVSATGEDTAITVTMRIVRWDVDEAAGTTSIRDVVEQEITFPVKNLDLAAVGRLREYIAALSKVIERALAHPDVATVDLDELVDFSALKLQKSQTEADFVAALSVPSRLGKYLR
ncbi:MAG: hypothetical protein ABI867_09455 [Kofleriaceae bacterium]